MAFTSLYREEDATVRAGLRESEISDALDSRSGLLWVHISGMDQADADLLRHVFGLHPLAVQDCLNPGHQRPKVDDFGSYIFIIVHGIDHAASEELVATTELDLFVGSNFVVTTSLQPLASIEHVVESAIDDPRLLERGPVLLAHALIDALVDAVSPTMDRMSDVADAIDEEALERPHKELLPAILRLKRSALAVHRIMRPQRELLSRLSRGDYSLVDRDHALYFRDIYDHVDRIEDASEALRERADFALTTYLSAVSIRQNETMRLLSIVAAVFLPLTLVAGIYGMNFEHMPELTWRYAYFVVLAAMFAFAVSVSWWLWGRHWIGVGRQRIGHQLHFAVEPARLREARLEAARLRMAVRDVTHVRDRRTPRR